MSAADVCGVLVLAYFTSCAVWTLCDAHREAMDAMRWPERPSSLPKDRS